MSDTLNQELKQAIQKFLDDRKANGGILLPDRVIIESAFTDVMRELELYPKPSEIAKTDKGIYYKTESDGQRARRLLTDRLVAWDGKTLDQMTDDECYECLRWVQQKTGVYYV